MNRARILSRVSRSGGPVAFLQQINMRPMEQLLWQKVIYKRENVNLRRGRVVSGYVAREITWGIHNESHLLVNIFGIQGSGKSMLALKIWKMIEREWKKLGKEPELYITFSMKETQAIFPRLKPGDVLIQDEDPALSGADARAIVNAVNNLQATMRARQISWLFLYPKPIYNLINPTLALEVVGHNPENRRTLAVAYNRLYIAEGWAWFDLSEVFEDEKLMNMYLELKNKALDKFQSSGGFVGAGMDNKEIMEWVQKVVDLWQKSNFPVKTTGDIDVLLDLANFQGTVHRRRTIKKLALREIQNIQASTKVLLQVKEKEKKKQEEEKKKVLVKRTTRFMGKYLKDMNFRMWLWELIKDMDEPPPQYTGSARQNMIFGSTWEVFKLIYEIVVNEWDPEIKGRQSTVGLLAERLGYSEWTISKTLRVMGESGFIGDMFERFWVESHGQEWTGRAGHRQADWVDPETGEVYSLKSSIRFKNRRDFRITSECQAEIREAQNRGFDYFYLVFVNPLWYTSPIIFKYELKYLNEGKETVSFWENGEVRLVVTRGYRRTE